MIRLLAGLVVAVLLAGCAAEPVWAPDEAVARATYVHPGPPEIALLTSLTDRAGEGAHSALIITGSQRVLFDPAGNFKHPDAPERNDVVFGISPDILSYYLGFQASTNYHAVVLRRQVTPEVAELALQLAMANGAVPKAMCASATSALLAQLPGFEDVARSMFPDRVMRSFATLPGVTGSVYYGAPGEYGKPVVDESFLPPGTEFVGG